MLSINIREAYMSYYDPLKIYKFLEDILISADSLNMNLKQH